jgi:hypothetical protein
MKFNEQLIKEKRTIEATKKEYMGPKGKLAIISMLLGSEIISQGEENQYIKYDNFWNNLEENQYTTIDENTPISSMGFFFYGLDYSYNIEIYYIENERLIKVIYEGQKVYEEINGELEAYAPSDTWEKPIEDLYVLARSKDYLRREEEKKKNKKVFEEKKNSILNRIKKIWGV